MLSWARYSDSADDFFLRIKKKGQAKMVFAMTIREALDARAGRAVTNAEFWGFLKCLVILHFDFQNGEVSRDGETIGDRLRLLFATQPATNATRLCERLIP